MSTIQELLKTSGQFDYNPETEISAPQPYSNYSNDTYHVISRVAYLIGVEKQHFENQYEPPKMEIYEELEKDKNARIVRNLCRIRTALEKYYTKIRTALIYDLKNLSSLPEWIPQDALHALEQDGVRIQKANPKIEQYIIAINKELSNRVENCKNIFPMWIEWKYINTSSY